MKRKEQQLCLKTKGPLMLTCLLVCCIDQESPTPHPLSKATVSLLSVAEADATSDFTNRGLGTWRIAEGCCPIDSVSTSAPSEPSDQTTGAQ